MISSQGRRKVYYEHLNLLLKIEPDPTGITIVHNATSPFEYQISSSEQPKIRLSFKIKPLYDHFSTVGLDDFTDYVDISNSQSGLSFSTMTHSEYPKNNNGIEGNETSNTVNGFKLNPHQIIIPVTHLELSGKVSFKLVTNDNTRESIMLLTKLKNVIQKQLKFMPKEYVSRIVYDLGHYSLVIVQEDQVLGGATFKHFEKQKFTELVFVCISEIYRRFVSFT
jgi:hypothetical protein